MDIGGQDTNRSFATAGASDEVATAAADAETLLRYASQAGVEVPAETVATIVQARADAADGRVAPEVAVAFYGAYARLAARLKPVSIDTLRVPDADTAAALRRIGAVSVALAVLLILCSILAFMANAMSSEIDAGIGHANELAVRLRDQVGPPATAITEAQICLQPTGAPDPAIPFPDKLLLTQELQDFAATARTLLTTASKLDVLVLQWEHSPLDDPPAHSPWADRPRALMQLNPDLIDHRAEAFCKIYAYEDVRDFARNVRADASAVFGAMAAYFLPVLYALLGAYAYTLRDFSERVKLRTYHPSSRANAARTIAAMTAGAIISLFNNLGQGWSLSPLAVAFLVGYGVEAFFAFLDALLTAFNANRRTAPAAAEAPAGRN